MTKAGGLQYLEFFIRAGKKAHITADLGKNRAPRSMPGIMIFILPATIMKNGE
jgi:hypothetical protein